jgi:hypothetical protein
MIVLSIMGVLCVVVGQPRSTGKRGRWLEGVCGIVWFVQPRGERMMGPFSGLFVVR